MPGIPLIFVWFAVLCGYLPYSMGYAFLNPMVIISYGFLGWLIGANVSSIPWAMAASMATTLLAIVMVNLSSGILHLVIPSLSVIGASLWLSVTGVMATGGLRAFGLRQGLHEESIRGRLRLGFAALATLAYFNSYLPFEWKMWLASRTTNPDLIGFALVWGALFVGTWRLTR